MGHCNCPLCLGSRRQPSNSFGRRPEERSFWPQFKFIHPTSILTRATKIFTSCRGKLVWVTRGLRIDEVESSDSSKNSQFDLSPGPSSQLSNSASPDSSQLNSGFTKSITIQTNKCHFLFSRWIYISLKTVFGELNWMIRHHFLNGPHHLALPLRFPKNGNFPIRTGFWWNESDIFRLQLFTKKHQLFSISYVCRGFHPINPISSF
jgi:hypothetical protein